MRKSSLLRNLGVAVAGLSLAAGVASAQGKGHDRDNKHAQRSREEYRVPPGLARQGKIPPGLAKKGGLPPGQAKKLYRADDDVVVLRDVFGRHGYSVVRTTTSGDTRYVYYRLGNGSVRRAIVLPGAGRPRFRNVPEALVREIYSRLN